ncbi:MAG: TraK family protein [Methylococcaceae bacterium]|nr:TraK family protein [Methylococcaceae bacterium]
MGHRYSDQIAEWVKQKQSRKRDKNLVAYLAVKEDVQAAMANGYAAKTIWAHLVETQRIAFGYDTFLNYTKRSYQPKTKEATCNTEKPRIEVKPTTETKPQPGFSFNSVPNKEELL